MCGIAGYLDASPERDRQLIARMCDRIAHRGPDSADYWHSGPVALGHRRLSIIDLSGGDQPIGNEDGSIQIIFNGEIYNYLELRRDLIAKGHQFTTNSDTETIVHLYEEMGERTPEALNGMFAFAIWDGKRQELFLARDRFGKKPIYYSFDTDLRFCFASELKALMAAPGFRRDVNPQAVADFLTFSYVPDPLTIFKGARKLPPAHSITVSMTGERMRRYWEPSFLIDEGMRMDDAMAELRSLAADCVERRLMSDVPLGGFLSGGVDSSACVALMSERAPERVQTFSIGFRSKEFDELEYARLMVDRYQTRHSEEVVSPDIGEMLGKLVEHFDEPFGDSSAIPMLYLSRMARKQVTVALSGDGADELFGGYRRYRFGQLEERMREKFPRWFRHSVIRAGGRYYPKLDFMPQVFRAKTLLTNLAQEIGDAYFTTMSTFRESLLAEVLSAGARRELDGYSPAAAYRQRFENVRHLPPLQQMQAVDLDTWLPGDILVKADRSTMAYSLESRSPWLDYRLAELSFRMPASLKIHGRSGKYIFKETVRPMVPDAIIDRPKMGFSVPLAHWFRTSLKPVFQRLLLDGGPMEEYISLPTVRRLWNEHQSGMHNHDRKLWNLLMLACWEERHHRNVEESATVAQA